MLRVLGSPKRLCDGLTRRDLLHAGAVGLFGLNLTEWASAKVNGLSRPGPHFGRARACILIYLYGAPSQLETFDPKPDAPQDIRGEFGSIETNVAGLQICEGLPRLARVMDKFTVLRTVTHPYPIHGVAFATTGIPTMELAMELSPRDARHWPFIGSVVDHLDERTQPAPPPLPRNLVLPWSFSSRRVGEVARAGPYGGFLGPKYDPVSAEFVGQATVRARKTLQEQVWEDVEPYRGITRESRFELSALSQPSDGLTLDRLDRRRSLLEQFDQARPDLERSLEQSGHARNQALAYSLIHSDRLRRAFDLGAEPDSTRDLYGMTLLGQACLTARRLIEHGGRFVTVFWDEYGLAGTGWDTHWDHYPRMRDELLPALDTTLSGLLIDLDRRGLLDETLVLVLSEHGRTPKITPGQNGGRDHWSRCYSVLMAGGGVARGRVIGRSDKIASDPVERPISPKDILATTYHLLGIDPQTELRDKQDRPLTLTPTGQVLFDALG
ncbi:MAG: hypothetical protein KatS3mg108_1124 [Isosphaeraceae bacterium]|jgi:hypothetical protein|nr:MAG: hypothetical protein KatS3mg108_1124 [Isosphaeraceae bacterium]